MRKNKLRKRFRDLPFQERKEFFKTIFSHFTLEMGLFHGAALSFYLIFTLIPLLYLAINVVGNYLGRETVTHFINRVLIDYFGIDDFSSILVFLESIKIGGDNRFLQYIGIGVLLFSCSAIFTSLKVSINHFYGVKPHFSSSKKRMLVKLIARLISFAFLAGVGVLLVSLYFLQFLFNSFGKMLLSEHVLMTKFWFYFTQHSLSILSMTIFLTIVFKYLNDAKVKWRVAAVGAVHAAVLLQLGQMVIQYYMNVAYFAQSGSLLSIILIILAFVYYGSQAIFIGAAISAAYGKITGNPILSRYRQHSIK